jgi:hypothetical protein
MSAQAGAQRRPGSTGPYDGRALKGRARTESLPRRSGTSFSWRIARPFRASTAWGGEDPGLRCVSDDTSLRPGLTERAPLGPESSSIAREGGHNRARSFRPPQTGDNPPCGNRKALYDRLPLGHSSKGRVNLRNPDNTGCAPPIEARIAASAALPQRSCRNLATMPDIFHAQLPPLRPGKSFVPAPRIPIDQMRPLTENRGVSPFLSLGRRH